MLAQAAASRGVRINDLLEHHGVGPALPEVADARVPHGLLVDLWEQVPRRLNDAALGLRLAQGAPRGTIELVEYCMPHSPDLGASYQKLTRWQRLLHDGPAITSNSRATWPASAWGPCLLSGSRPMRSRWA
jgi:hypothetical protein